MKRRGIILSGLGLIVTLTACAHQIVPESTVGAPGFLLGLWHGFVAPIAFAGHVFNHDVRMYAYPNTGGWYDFGSGWGSCS